MKKLSQLLSIFLLLCLTIKAYSLEQNPTEQVEEPTGAVTTTAVDTKAVPPQEATSYEAAPSEQQKAVEPVHTKITAPTQRIETFDPKKLRLVEYNSSSGNYLFRGNIPIKKQRFAYEELFAHMSEQSEKELGVPLPKDTLILVVSLISPFTENKLLQIEERYAERNSDSVRLYNHPIYGALSSPNLYPQMLKGFMLYGPILDDVNELTPKIKKWMVMGRSRPKAIYVHCRVGSDRTGLVLGTYQMQYRGMPYKEAMAEAEEIAGRPLTWRHKRGLQWMAYYLRDHIGVQTVGNIKQ